MADYLVFIANRVYELRNKKNISARKLGLDLGLSSSYFTQLENNKRSLSLDVLFAICDYFEISICEFFAPFDKTSETLYSSELKELVKLAKRLEPSKLEALVLIFKQLL